MSVKGKRVFLKVCNKYFCFYISLHWENMVSKFMSSPNLEQGKIRLFVLNCCCEFKLMQTTSDWRTEQLGKLRSVCLLVSYCLLWPSFSSLPILRCELYLLKFSGHQKNFQGRWKNNPGWKPGFQVLMSYEFRDKHGYKQCIKLIYPETENFAIFQEE